MQKLVWLMLILSIVCLCCTRPYHAIRLPQKLRDLQSSMTSVLEELVRINETLVEMIAAATCPENFTRYKGSCYYFSANIPELGWDGAKVLCQMKGSDLVAIETRQESDFLYTQTSVNSWTSGHRHLHSSYWIWESTGINITDGYHLWQTDEPNQDAFCMYLYSRYNAKLCDWPCHTTEWFGYICETILPD